jgi:hypothetical protein
MVNKPTGLVKIGPNGSQAVSISIMPDFMSATERAAILEKSALVNGIDINPDLKY